MKNRHLINRISIILSVLILCILTFEGVDMLTKALTVDANDPLSKSTLPAEIINKFGYSNTPVNIFLLAGDQSSGNTDTMMIIHFEPKTCKTRIISIPRDTAVLINNEIRRINFA